VQPVTRNDRQGGTGTVQIASKPELSHTPIVSNLVANSGHEKIRSFSRVLTTQVVISEPEVAVRSTFVISWLDSSDYRLSR
jgi:hypothetical protein